MSESRPLKRRLNKRITCGVILICAGVCAYFVTFGRQNLGDDGKLVRQVVSSEELILELTPQLDRVARGLMNLQLPTPQDADEIFAPSVSIVDVTVLSEESPTSESSMVNHATFSIGERSELQREQVNLWHSVFEHVAYLDHASFGFVKGAFLGEGFDLFEATVKLSGLARKQDGDWMALSGKQVITWTRDQASEEWQISGWEIKSLKATTSGQLLFSESLDQAVPREGDRYRARLNRHQREVVRYYKTNKTQAPTIYFAPIAMNQKPAISVVDVNGDGFDDLYVMVRIGKNLLFVNRGDGTFVEQSADYELAVPGNSTCGLFADFDNDGDADLLLGRSVERCMYLENAGGWFVQRPMDDVLPFLAASMSAADYNGDGLLDVYISTYRPEVLGGTSPTGGTGTMENTWPEDFFTPEQAREFRERFAKTKKGGGKYGTLLEQVGPPNVLLVNKGGGKFERAPENPALELWANTLQSTWADFDDDGDPDLYVANDWARDYLFRNDGEQGFTDIANDAGANVFGFGMGASWGDYDNDGRQDLYVSNMFSKAGLRIMRQIDGLDENYRVSAEGNYLYRHSEGGKFERVSGLEPPALLVADGGWSWGGQFVDFDNDADLDIYTMSGYFTAPPEVASTLDL